MDRSSHLQPEPLDVPAAFPAPDLCLAALRALPGATLLADAEGRVVFLNAAAETLTGWSHLDAVGRPLRQVLHNAGEVACHALADPAVSASECAATPEHACGVTLTAPDGREYVVDVHAVALHGDAGVPTGVVLTLREPDAREHAAEAPAETDGLLHALLGRSPDGIVMLDSRGRVLEWSEGEEAITGIPRSEALGQPLWDIQSRLAPEERRTSDLAAAARDAILAGIQEGVSLERVLEDEIQRPDGSRRVVQSRVFAIQRGSRILACGICRDITDHKHAEAP